jgi:signal peptidase I
MKTAVIFPDNSRQQLLYRAVKDCGILELLPGMNAVALERSKRDLATQVLRSWGTLRLRVTGLSMLPTLWPGDVLTLGSLDFEHAEPGELVLYMREERFFVHRVIRKSGAGDSMLLITRGDCMVKDDPPVPADGLLGKVTGIQRDGLVLRPSQRISLASRIFAGMLSRWSLLRDVALRLRMRAANAPAGTDFVAFESAQ